jgi:hypothetical protein
MATWTGLGNSTELFWAVLSQVDLKPLPKGLKYEFLGPDKTYPIIVSDELSPEENEKLLNLLKKHR